MPWRAWARSLLARRFRVTGSPPAPAMLLARVSAPAPRTRCELAVIRLEPRIELSLRTFPTFLTNATVLKPVAGTRQWSERAAHPVVNQLCRESVRRIVEERRRIELQVQRLTEATAQSYRAPVRAGSEEPESSRAGLGLRDREWLERSPVQTLPSLPRAEGSTGDGIPATDVADASDRVALGTPQPTAPAVDLESLTDQVVRQIDRRIVAHRERVGRI